MLNGMEYEFLHRFSFFVSTLPNLFQTWLSQRKKSRPHWSALL